VAAKRQGWSVEEGYGCLLLLSPNGVTTAVYANHERAQAQHHCDTLNGAEGQPTWPPLPISTDAATPMPTANNWPPPVPACPIHPVTQPCPSPR
jgi:hypothetical protein